MPRQIGQNEGKSRNKIRQDLVAQCDSIVRAPSCLQRDPNVESTASLGHFVGEAWGVHEEWDAGSFLPGEAKEAFAEPL